MKNKENKKCNKKENVVSKKAKTQEMGKEYYENVEEKQSTENNNSEQNNM